MILPLRVKGLVNTDNAFGMFEASCRPSPEGQAFEAKTGLLLLGER